VLRWSCKDSRVHVDPSEVRKQTRKSQEAFDKHEDASRNNREKVHKWRAVSCIVWNRQCLWTWSERPVSIDPHIWMDNFIFPLNAGSIFIYTRAQPRGMGACRMFGWAWCKWNCNKTGSIFEDDPITFISRTRPCSHEFSIQLFLRFMLCDELDSRNCNIEEESISSDLGCLSSLRLLNPSGNNFPTLHASFRGVSKLERLYMDNRKRLDVSD